MENTNLPSGESVLTVQGALAEMRAGREEQASDEAEPNPVSEAARTLGKAAAEKRKASQQEQPSEDSEDVEAEEEDPEVESEPLEEDQADEEDGESEGETEEDEEDGEAAIEIDGELLTADEIKQRTLRQADYTRKTQALAEERRQLEAQTSEKLQQLDSLSATLQPEPEPDWAQVALEDPDWQLRKLQFDQKNQAIQQAHEAAQQASKTQLQQAQRRTVEELTSGDYKPEWTDQGKFQEDLTKIEKFALDMGATPEDIAAFYQPWHIKVFDMAMQAQARSQKVETAKKKVVNKPKVVKSRSRTGLKSAVNREVERAQANFDANPSIEAGKALMQAKRKAS